MSEKKRGKKAASPPRSIWLTIIILVIFAIFYQMNDNDTVQTVDAVPTPADSEIRVCFLDVGQGDSILIQTADNAVLIDGGDNSARKALLTYLQESNVKSLDYVIATHPHSDHIGGLPAVIGQYEVGEVLMPDVTANTASYDKLLKAIEDKDIPVTIPVPGDVFKAGLIELTTLAPTGTGYDNVNNYSLVFRMVYGEKAFLFTGDAEVESEREMLAAGYNLRANILKAGHHGSSTATSDDFLDAVNPTAVAISCGKNNTYGHPHVETMEKLNVRNITSYRTDLLGSIIMATDGKEIRLYANNTSTE